MDLFSYPLTHQCTLVPVLTQEEQTTRHEAKTHAQMYTTTNPLCEFQGVLTYKKKKTKAAHCISQSTEKGV